MMLPSLRGAHFGDDQIAEPLVGHHIDAQDFFKGAFGQVERGAEVGVDGGVADQDVDVAERFPGLVDQHFQLVDVGDVAGNINGPAAALGVDLIGHRLADIPLAA